MQASGKSGTLLNLQALNLDVTKLEVAEFQYGNSKTLAAKGRPQCSESYFSFFIPTI